MTAPSSIWSASTEAAPLSSSPSFKRAHGAPRPVVRLSVDCMGGDHGASVTLPACKAFLARRPEAALILVGRPEALAAARDWERCTLLETDEVVEMDDPIEVALRRKKQSSLRLALQQLRPVDGAEAAAHVCVSAGNTGALMAVARYLLKTIDGIDRPAIASVMPNRRGRYTTLLDLGANVDCSPEHLLQFAVLGSALVSAVDGTAQPSVGLLNVGEESIKGSETIKQAGELLRAASEGGHINFHGNVEGDDIFKGTTDIVVCDGFVGNVALKTAEGLASYVGMALREEFSRGWAARLAALVSLPVLNRLKGRMDHRRYNGAALLGLRGLVFKSHGSADAFGFEQALHRAFEAVHNGLLEGVQARVASTLNALPGTAATAAQAQVDGTHTHAA